MKLINPITWNNTMLTSSTVDENDHAAWNSGTAYVVGDRVIRTTTHKIYECLVNNTNFTPEDNLTGATPKWLEIGATNKYKMVDDKFGTQTTATNTLTVTVTPGVAIDSLALLNLIGDEVTISCVVSGLGTIYTKTISLQTDIGVYDWYTYFLAPIVAQDDVVVTDLLPYNLQVITITITGTGTVAIGNVALGAYVTLGDTQYSPKIGIIDYSTKENDAFGNITVVERAYSKRVTCNIAVQNNFVDQLASLLASLRAVPVVWVGAEGLYASLIVWGYFKDFDIDITYPEISYCNLTIEGLV